MVEFNYKFDKLHIELRKLVSVDDYLTQSIWIDIFDGLEVQNEVDSE